MNSRMISLIVPLSFRPSRIWVRSCSRRFSPMKEALLSLSPTELRSLAANLRSGRLSSPYSASSLGRFLS